jgi:hypothetical protein
MSLTRGAAILTAVLLLGSLVVAQEEPAPKHRVFVELFTSQG